MRAKQAGFFFSILLSSCTLKPANLGPRSSKALGVKVGSGMGGATSSGTTTSSATSSGTTTGSTTSSGTTTGSTTSSGTTTGSTTSSGTTTGSTTSSGTTTGSTTSSGTTTGSTTSSGTTTGSTTSSGTTTGSTTSSGTATSSATSSGSGVLSSGDLPTGTVNIAYTESSGTTGTKLLSGAYVPYLNSVSANYIRYVSASSANVYTKSQITTQVDCPIDCTAHPTDASCQTSTVVPSCTLGSWDFSWSFCAADSITSTSAYTYTTCIAAAVESGNVVEYPEGDLNVSSGVYPNMGYELPYMGYANIARCERRAGDTTNKIYNYSAAAEGTLNGHHGSLDFLRFDASAPSTTNTNSPIISFKLTNGRFVEYAYPAPTNPVTFNATVDAQNIEVLYIPPCKPRL